MAGLLPTTPAPPPDPCFKQHQLERVLASEQRRSDFLPRDDAAVSFDRPTPACLLGTALLQALGVAASDALEGANLRLFLTEVGARWPMCHPPLRVACMNHRCAPSRASPPPATSHLQSPPSEHPQVSRRAAALLLSHMCRFTYSPSGALKWKKDVGEYADTLAGFGVASGAEEDMAHMQQLLNVLIVAPESLLGLVNGTLRMAHRYSVCVVAVCVCVQQQSGNTLCSSCGAQGSRQSNKWLSSITGRPARLLVCMLLGGLPVCNTTQHNTTTTTLRWMHAQGCAAVRCSARGLQDGARGRPATGSAVLRRGAAGRCVNAPW